MAERERVDYEGDGERLSGDLFHPQSGNAAPGVVLIPAIHGRNDYVLDVGSRLADEGYAVLLLDLYCRGDHPGDLTTPDEIKAAVAALPDDRVTSDVIAAGHHLASLDDVEGDRVATMGFCIGGQYAFLAACRDDVVAAAVNFYGMIRYTESSNDKPRSPIDCVPELRAPMLSHYGDRDHLCPPADSTELAERMATEGKIGELYQYPGAGHAFHEHHRPQAYRPVAAATAWQRSLTFIAYYLKGTHA